MPVARRVRRMVANRAQDGRGEADEQEREHHRQQPFHRHSFLGAHNGGLPISSGAVNQAATAVLGSVPAGFRNTLAIYMGRPEAVN